MKRSIFAAGLGAALFAGCAHSPTMADKLHGKWEALNNMAMIDFMSPSVVRVNGMMAGSTAAYVDQPYRVNDDGTVQFKPDKAFNPKVRIVFADADTFDMNGMTFHRQLTLPSKLAAKLLGQWSSPGDPVAAMAGRDTTSVFEFTSQTSFRINSGPLAQAADYNCKFTDPDTFGFMNMTYRVAFNGPNKFNLLSLNTTKNTQKMDDFFVPLHFTRIPKSQ